MEQNAEKSESEVGFSEKAFNEEKPANPLSEPQEDPQARYDDLNNRYLRLAADFENFRKRTERDMGNRISLAIESFACDLLEVSDNLDRALKEETGESREGLAKIAKLFHGILAKHGLVPIETDGARFSPAEHEAIACVASHKPDGTIVDEIAKGYLLNGKVIRCSKVVVSTGKEEV